ncbi:MAG: ABC transporter ATP-binding protein [Treponema sp.]|jgi:energy-coupling factor transport system ATP-binding protein|nr:ABC transporter ATP-binding protein [Treponema sp.]
MNHCVLEFNNFSFQYRSQTEPTLKDITFRVKKGEKVLILGRSGSGKSTLIHCINGLIPHAYKGTVWGEYNIMGKDGLSLGIFEISKRAGTVLQDSDGQFMGLSAAEDIAFAAENDCVPTAELRRRAAETAALVGMEGHLSKSPQDLSGGQKQRVSMAGVLMDDVDILLFDEPLANLDPAAGMDAIELIDKLHKDTGKTILIVEHRLEDVLHRPVDRIVLFDEGRIAADLPPAEMLASGLLPAAGIREPLYVSALRYAGVPVTAASRPECPETLSFDKAALTAWCDAASAPRPETPPPLLEIIDLCFTYERVSYESSDYERAGRDACGENDRRGHGSGTPGGVEHISFFVGRGECMSLVGENGAGKSTLAKLVCGFCRPDSGALYFNGEDLAPLTIMERAERIGYVMQNPNQMISFPMIYDEVASGLRNRDVGEHEIRDRVYDALKVCGLYPFRNWPVSALSYGQKKRLTIAAILVLNPGFIIMDEPTAGQDYRHYTEFMEFLKKLNSERGLSLLLITHDMHLMLEYTPRAAVLAGGKCLAVKESVEVLTDRELIRRARLKQTSLYDLALKSGIADPQAFIRRFIAHENRLRAAGYGGERRGEERRGGTA